MFCPERTGIAVFFDLLYGLYGIGQLEVPPAAPPGRPCFLADCRCSAYATARAVAASVRIAVGAAVRRYLTDFAEQAVLLFKSIDDALELSKLLTIKLHSSPPFYLVYRSFSPQP